MTAKLELHLKLDGFQVENRWHDGNGVVVTRLNLVEDSSGNNHTSALFGNADIVADDAFGACADFDGDVKSYIKVPSAQPLKIAGDVTLEAWVYITKAATGWVRVIGKGTSDSRSYGLWYQMTGTTITCLFQRGDRKPFDDCTAVLKTTPLNTWYHLAGVVEGKKSSLYVHDLKGKLIGKAELDNKSSGATLDNDSHVTIGHSLFPNHAAHSGKIAHARIYRGALSQAEIERDISSDRLALVPFRKSHPIDFRLNDEDDQPALYIVDDSADAKITSLKVELTNSATQAIHIPPAAPATDRDHHHFALRFRPGTLSAPTIGKLTALTPLNQATVLKETDHWELACVVGLTGPVTLYVSYKGPERSFQPQEQLTLNLHGISADAGSGSRGTQVELIPHQLTYVGDDTPITGSRMRYIHITNHRGQKNIPLHVWFAHGNTVLNDGESTTDLTLRIGNGSADRDIILNEKSRFVISFDVGEDWALTDKTNADRVKVTHGKTELPRPGHGQETNDTFREWELKFPKQQVLAKRGSTNSVPTEIALKGIITNLSSGHANLYVRYERIPGYQDGQFVLIVEKSPLAYSKGKADVAGTLVADKLSVSRKTEDRGGLFFAVAGDFNHAVYNNLSNLDGEGKWDGAKWNTFGGLNIRVGNRNAKPPTLRSALLINATGHVGIGTDLVINKDLVSSLTINKKIAHDAGYVYSAAPLSIFLPLEKHNGGSAPVGTEDILHLAREGVTSAAYGNKVSLAIGRYENDGQNSRTQLDIKLTDGHFTDHKAVLSLRSNGYVGIGTDAPDKNLDVHGELQVRAHHDNATPSIGTFYDKSKSQGMGIGPNQIAAIGSNISQSVLIKPKGPQGVVKVVGRLEVEGNLQVDHLLNVNRDLIVHGDLTLTGRAIFAGKRWSDSDITAYKISFKSNQYPTGCCILFMAKGEDLNYLVKKADGNVEHRRISSSRV